MRGTGEISTYHSLLDCHFLVHSLQGLCASMKELADHPSNFVLHRTQCCCLSRSYNLAVRHIARKVDHADLHAQKNLLPSLLELYQVMLQGEKFMRDCLYQDGWVKKALLLAFSSEAQDVCLHDLVWCLCVIQKATGELWMADDEQKTNIFACLNAEWNRTSGEEDLRILQAALEAEISNEAQTKVANSKKNVNAHWRLARFLLRKVIMENDGAHGSISSDKLPHYYWVDPREFVIKDLISQGPISVERRVEWCGEIFVQKEIFHENKDLFHSEAAIQASLRHPNVLHLICCTALKPAANNFGLVMEMMDTNLRSMINDRRDSGFEPPFSLLTAVDLMLQIAKGMEYLHSLNFMHRDLKSMNILVSKQVSGYASSGDCRLRAKVADFGTSIATNRSSEFLTLNVGTTYWRAPEVFHVYPEHPEVFGVYTIKSDVYSFGMVCYEILSGNIPFDDGGNIRGHYQRLKKGERPKLPSSCPQSLASYIESCWHGEPSIRPSFSQISRTLRHLKGILLTSGNPLSSLALSGQAGIFIEEKLDQVMGSNWTSTTWPRVTSKSITETFEMSWYQDMETKSFEKEVLDVKGRTTNTMIQAIDGPKRARKKGSLSKLVTWIMRRLICCMEKSHDKAEGSIWVSTLSPENGRFTYAELDKATHHFEFSSLIGRGGIGSVYKGTLADGRVVAVKVMHERSWRTERDFRTELALLLGKRHHRNLVPLLGFCLEAEQAMLVYKYMPRGDLGSVMRGKRPSWAQRVNILCGVAAALNYLHDHCRPQIVHRDVKPNNILLDDEYNAHLTDFGIARTFRDDDSNVTTVVVGTMGYIAPEYFMTCKLGPEADVYSFGVVVLEVMTGRRALETDGKHGARISVIHHVWTLYQQGMLLDAGDATVKLESQHDEEKMKHLLLLGLACSQSNPSDRPTMRHVVQVLSGAVGPPTPAHPPYGMEDVRVQSQLFDKEPLSFDLTTCSTGSEGMTSEAKQENSDKGFLVPSLSSKNHDAESVEQPADEEPYWSMDSSRSLDDALLP